MQLNAGLEYLHGLLPIEVVITDESGAAPLEIMKSVLMMTTVTTSLLVKIPILSQFPNIVIIRGIEELQRDLESPEQTPVVVEFESHLLK